MRDVSASFGHIEAATETATAGRTASSTYPPTEEIGRGTSVGRYVILDRIGEGGMGVVYAAYDSALDRKVALKFLATRRADQGGVDETRLVREAQAMARLSHPNVVAVYEVGTWEEHVFVAMEFVDGVDLGGWLKVQKRTTTEILDVFRGAGQGLAHAHSVGIVHRDFKPGNILVDRRNRPRVTDFGISRAVRTEGDESSGQRAEAQERADEPADVSGPSLLAAPLTRTGEVHGTPRYMSPEHRSGAPTDERSDQFSFCVALYEALYGVHPFEGSTLTDLLDKVASGSVNPPPAGSPAPRWCGKVIERGLRTRPEERFPSMDALLAALDRHPRSIRLRIGLTLASILALGLVVMGFLVGYESEEDRCTGGQAELAAVWNRSWSSRVRGAFAATGQAHAASSAARVAERLDAYTGGWTAMHRAACRATARGEQSPDLLDRRMACLDRRLGQVQALVELLVHRADRAVVDKAIDMVAKLEPLSVCADAAALLDLMAPPADPVQRARVAELQRQVDRADAERQVGRNQAAADSVRAVLEAERQLGNPRLAAQAERVLSMALNSLGHVANSRDAAYRALHLAEKAGDARLAIGVLIELVYQIGTFDRRHTEVKIVEKMAVAALERPAARGDLGLRASLLVARGAVASDEGQVDQALQYVGEALAIYRRTLSPHDLAVAKAETVLGNALTGKGDFEGARDHLQRSLAIMRRVYGDLHPNVALGHMNLGVAYGEKGRVLEEHEEYQAALAILERMPDHRFYLDVLNNMGTLESSLGHVDSASEHLEAALVLQVRKYGEEHADVATTMYNLAEVSRSKGDLHRALELNRRAAEIRAKTVGTSHPWYAEDLVAIGEDLRRLGRPSESMPYHEQARKIIAAQAGSGQAESPNPVTYRGLLLADLGRHREAIPLLEQTLARLVPSDPDRARSAFALARALEPRGPRTTRATMLALEALSTFTIIRANREIEDVRSYLARGRPERGASGRK